MRIVIEELEDRRARGKLTARERIERLPDAETFGEFGMFVEHRSTDFGRACLTIAGDGVATVKAPSTTGSSSSLPRISPSLVSSPQGARRCLDVERHDV